MPVTEKSEAPLNETDIANEIIAEEPRVREEIVSELQKANEQETTENPENNTNAPNESGQSYSNNKPQQEAFNPALHEVNENGQPRLTKDGRFRRKRGRSTGYKAPNTSGMGNATTSGKGTSNTANENTSSTNASGAANYAATASIASGVMFSAAQMIGPEWAPSDNERTQVESAMATYFESQGIQDIPPGIALVLVIGIYAFPRIQHENTRNKIRSFGETLGLIQPKKPERKPVVNVNEAPRVSVPPVDSSSFSGINLG